MQRHTADTDYKGSMMSTAGIFLEFNRSKNRSTGCNSSFFPNACDTQDSTSASQNNQADVVKYYVQSLLTKVNVEAVKGK